METRNADADIITLAGKQYTFCITPYGLMMADDMGIDVLSEFDKMRTDQLNGTMTPIRAMKVFSKIIWAGIVYSHPEVTLEHVQRSMESFSELSSYADIIARQMARLLKGNETGEAKAPTKGRKR